MKKIWLYCVIPALAMLLLILDARTAITGATDGIALSLSSVIPSLFPFLVLSGILMPMLSNLDIPLLRKIGKAFGIPAGAESIFFTGLIGGYPIGAQLVSKAYEQGRLARKDAQRMLGFCSNCGPAFLFGIIGIKFAYSWMPWVLWGIHIFSAITVAGILPEKSKNSSCLSTSENITWIESLKSAVHTMGFICGWVILFRMVLAFLERWILWILPQELRVFCYGILELSNGCCSLEQIPNTGLRAIICSAMISFGGICVAMQTASVCTKIGLGQYVPGKILQSMISVFSCFLMQYFLLPSGERIDISPHIFILLVCILFATVLIAVKPKIRGRNPVSIGV